MSDIKGKGYDPQVKDIPLLDPILTVLLIVVHHLWSLFYLSNRGAAYMYHWVLSLWVENYRANLGSLKNIPTHVAIGISTPSLNYDKLAQLIDWCKRVPTIRTVTIFHPYSQGEPVELKSLLTPAGEESEFTITFLPFNTGRQSLVDAARTFASIRSLPGPVTQTDITDYLKAYYPNPDPELLLMFGDIHSYAGFPCWQIRLTETVFLPPLDWVTPSQFHQALKVFSKCEQRYGT